MGGEEGRTDGDGDLQLGAHPAPARPKPSCGRDFFSFLYLKKIKISKIYGRFENFQNYTPVAPCLGDRGPVAHWLGDRT